MKGCHYIISSEYKGRHIYYLPFDDVFCENFRQTKKEWDCQGCHDGVVMLAVFYQDDDVVQVITTELQGEDFCGNPENGFTEDQISECVENIAGFMPRALQIIGDAVIDYNNEICNAWYEGICE